MDQSRQHQVLYLPVVLGSAVATAPRSSAEPAKPAMLARPAARNFRFGRAAGVLAQAGQRLALITRRIGQPADTYSGPGYQTPEDIRARYSAGIFGVTETPRSLRDADRRW